MGPSLGHVSRSRWQFVLDRVAEGKTYREIAPLYRKEFNTGPIGLAYMELQHRRALRELRNKGESDGNCS